MFDRTNSQITYGIRIINRGPQTMIPCISPVCIGLGYKPETEVLKFVTYGAISIAEKERVPTKIARIGRAPFS